MTTFDIWISVCMNGACVDISIYISRLRNAGGGHVIGRSLYVVMLNKKNKRCIFTCSKYILQ